MIDPEVLLQGYRLGVFPMAMDDGEIEWFSPDPRAILPLREFHVPHTLVRAARKKSFEIRINVSFVEVMRECARDVEFVQRQNRARIRREPLDGTIRHRHRENAEPIALKQHFGIDHWRRVTDDMI